MILHHNYHFTYNHHAAFKLPNGMCFDFHPETELWDDGFQLIAPDESFKLVLTFATVDKDAETFAAEIYEERENVHVIEPVHAITTPRGLHGCATLFEYTKEVIEEITLDLPGEEHALLNVRFWRLKQPYDEALYAQVKAEILANVQLV